MHILQKNVSRTRSGDGGLINKLPRFGQESHQDKQAASAGRGEAAMAT